jgi:hypothetical protein
MMRTHSNSGDQPMKLIALAAALAISGTAIAQETPQQTPPPAEPTTPGQDMNQPTTPGTTGAGTATDPGATPPAMPATTQAPATATSSETPRGGFAPTWSPVSTGAPPAPGQQVIFAPSKSPNEAFPPPPPRDHYPYCKRGQYTGCMQRGERR